MTVHKDLCDMRTWAEVCAHYYDMYPLLREYDRIVAENNVQPSINDPMLPGSVDTMEGTRRALIAIGKPPRDEDDVMHAERWLNAVWYEMRSVVDAPDPTLADEIIDTELSYAGRVMTAEVCESMPLDKLEEHADLLASECRSSLLRSHLKEALVIALPTIYRRITVQDQRSRLRSVTE